VSNTDDGRKIKLFPARPIPLLREISRERDLTMAGLMKKLWIVPWLPAGVRESL